MTVYIKEIKQSFKAWCIWTFAISFMLMMCVLVFPETKGQMESLNNVFANMGSFSSAFGLDELNFGELMGFYKTECGNTLGIGSGLFSALIGISALSAEEKEHTAEFLLTHPVSRFSVVMQKLLSVLTQIIFMNIVIIGIALLSSLIIGESFEMRPFFLMHMAYIIMQTEIACICFGISAFIRRGSVGAGLGIAVLFYFMNIISNITEKADFLKYITPYAYADSSSIISESRLEMNLICIGILISAFGILTAVLKYTKKDIL
ncbi:MAG: ABC transporter permease subunit [Ruminococcus sp.]|nr:ABC transporter permease subunit [Oscillospiraceae bacterium]